MKISPSERVLEVIQSTKQIIHTVLRVQTADVAQDGLLQFSQRRIGERGDHLPLVRAISHDKDIFRILSSALHLN